VKKKKRLEIKQKISKFNMNKFASLVEGVTNYGSSEPPTVHTGMEFESILDAFEMHFHYDRGADRPETDLAKAKTIAIKAVNDSRFSEDMKELIKKDILSKTSVVKIHDYLAFHC